MHRALLTHTSDLGPAGNKESQHNRLPWLSNRSARRIALVSCLHKTAPDKETSAANSKATNAALVCYYAALPAFHSIRPCGILESAPVTLSKNSFLCAMTLSISDQPSHWHRVTKRHSLLNDATIDPFPYRDHRAASLLDHHIVRDGQQDARVADNGRRSTVPILPHPAPPLIAAPPPPPALDPGYPTSVVHPEHFRDTRNRSMQEMAGPDISEGSSSPTSTGQMEGGNQFCLCQPEPKIPRPRNGKDPCCPDFRRLTMPPSLYSLPPAPTSRGGSSEPWPSQSGHIQDHRRTMEPPARGRQK